MGLFDFFKKPSAADSDSEFEAHYSHPTLGRLEDNDGDWGAEKVRIPIFEKPLSVSLEGDEGGPSEDALAGYEYIVENWDAIIESYGIFDAFYEMHENYADGMGIELVEKSKFWESVVPQHLMVTSKDTLSFTVTFLWQDPGDDHIITAEVENGECVGCPVDG